MIRSRRFAAVLVVAAMLEASFAACGGSSTNGSSADPDAAAVDAEADTFVSNDASDVSVDAANDAPNDADAMVDAAPVPCTRGAEARTAPASLYDALVADLATIAGSGPRATRIDAFLAAVASQGGTPLEDGAGRTVFVNRGAPPNGPWSVVGSFQGWSPAAALPMAQVADSDLWILDTNAIAKETSHRYKLLSGADASGYVEDSRANNVAWDGVVRGGPTDFNAGRFDAIVHPASIPTSKGRLVRHGSLSATMLGNTRRIYVYFPVTYDDGTCSDFPTIAFQDGNEVLTRGDYATAADALYASTPALSSVLVFAELASPDIQQRIDEYTFGTGSAKGAQYVDFLANDLWPSISGSYRVCNRQEARGVAGASLGGLVSSYAAFAKPSQWGWVGSQSGSYWWSGSALVTRAQNDAKIPVRFYLDSSCPNDNCTDVDAFASALQGKGYDVLRVTTPVPSQPPDPHDWSFFKTRATQLLTHFRSGVAVCN